MTDRELMQQALEALENGGHMTYDGLVKAKAAGDALRERLAQPEFDSSLQSATMTQTAPKLAQPEQSALDRMAENARELGLDYEPVQEPVAMRYDFDGYGYRYIDSGSGSNWQTRIKDGEPLYTTPPRCPNCASLEAQNTELDAKLAQMEWQGLTPEDLEELIGFHGDTNGHMGEADARQFAADLQARLRERNASVLALAAADKEVS